jgi:hypothetical protein
MWVSERIAWNFKCKCGLKSGQYTISPVGVVDGEFPKLKCRKCKVKWNKKTARWRTLWVR